MGLLVLAELIQQHPKHVGRTEVLWIDCKNLVVELLGMGKLTQTMFCESILIRHG